MHQNVAICVEKDALHLFGANKFFCTHLVLHVFGAYLNSCRWSNENREKHEFMHKFICFLFGWKVA